MGKKSRDKGARGERAVVELLRPLFPRAARRSTGEESQERQGVDLKNTGRLVVQVQCAAVPTIEAKLREAMGVAGKDEVPVAFTRRSSRTRAGPWTATLLADDFVRLLGRVFPRTEIDPEAGP
jgi:hypothetical protein